MRTLLYNICMFTNKVRKNKRVQNKIKTLRWALPSGNFTQPLGNAWGNKISRFCITIIIGYFLLLYICIYNLIYSFISSKKTHQNHSVDFVSSYVKLNNNTYTYKNAGKSRTTLLKNWLRICFYNLISKRLIWVEPTQKSDLN